MKKKKINQDFITLAGLVVLYAVVAVMLYTGNMKRQISNMLIPVSVYIVLAVSLNLVVGLLGELSLGHAGFLSVGLFSGCMLSVALNGVVSSPLRMILSMLLGGLVAAVFGLVAGLPALRLRGDYLAIVTLAFCEIIKSIITNLDFTGGAMGIDTSSIYSNSKTLLPYAAALVFVTVAASMNIKKSRQGRAVMAIRDNIIAAESIGINTTSCKLMIFVVAAFFAGAAGSLYGHAFANVKATSFDYNTSIEILVIVVLGGMGSVRGSIIAAIVLKALPEALRQFSDYRMLVYAVILILVMIVSNTPSLQAYREKLKLPVLTTGRKGK